MTNSGNMSSGDHRPGGKHEVHCNDCGTKGNIKQGYGGVYAVECPNCGNKWSV